MKFLISNARTLVAAVVIALVVGGTAYAANKINGGNIKKNTVSFSKLNKKAQKKILKHNVKGTRINKRSIPFGKLDEKARNKILNNSGTAGPTGPTGPTGSAEYMGANWGVSYRNTIGSPVAQLRGGPSGAPYGIGSLGLEVADTSAETEKVAFLNEVDFLGDPIADLNAVGFQVMTTGENSASGVNMPAIAFEINPNGAGGTSTLYSTLQFLPGANSVANAWSPYIDATSSGSGSWGLTGSQFNTPATAANCGINGPKCSFDDLKAFLATGAGAVMYSAGISKGRDAAWQGAVDGLRINDNVYDFEPFGVDVVAAP